MSFEPTKRPPKLHLDRWVIVAESRDAAVKWLRANFKSKLSENKNINLNTTGNKFIAAPIFDPSDTFEIHYIESASQLYGLNFYEVIDIRPQRTIDQDNVLLDHSLTRALMKSISSRRPANVLQSPHPEPIKEEHRDKLDLCRRWIAPDPFIRPEPDDQRSTPDGPQWLVAPKRLR